jgi:hypothetical protein
MHTKKLPTDEVRVKRSYKRKNKSLSKLLTDIPVNTPSTDTTELGQIHMIVSTINSMDESTKNRVLNYLFSRYQKNITIPK